VVCSQDVGANADIPEKQWFIARLDDAGRLSDNKSRSGRRGRDECYLQGRRRGRRTGAVRHGQAAGLRRVYVCVLREQGQ
jgi:hypothetical protein